MIYDIISLSVLRACRGGGERRGKEETGRGGETGQGEGREGQEREALSFVLYEGKHTYQEKLFNQAIIVQTFENDSEMLAPDMFYHRGCIKCAQCSRQPDNETPIMMAPRSVSLPSPTVLTEYFITETMMMSLLQKFWSPTASSVMLKNSRYLP